MLITQYQYWYGYLVVNCMDSIFQVDYELWTTERIAEPVSVSVLENLIAGPEISRTIMFVRIEARKFLSIGELVE